MKAPLSQWYETPKGRQRLFDEQAVLAQHYPGFQLDLLEDGTAFVHGHLGGNGTVRGRYEVVLVLPPTYSNGALPRAFVLSPELPRDAPHLYADGSLCVDHNGAFTARSSAVTMLSWMLVWLVLYEEWRESGKRW